MDCSISLSRQGIEGCVSISLPEGLSRSPTAFVVVVDSSGSMGSMASIPDPETGEVDGLTRLDLVKHALRTTVEVLNENDRLAVVDFNNSANVILPLTQITAGAKPTIVTKLNTDLKPSGGTNIWQGLRIGYDIANQAAEELPTHQICLLLLTDGVATNKPSSGLVNTVAKMVAKNPNVCSISCFGFGYQLEIQDLIEISECHNGIYGFIPDASMIGTVFINYLANQLAGQFWNLTLDIHTKNGTSSFMYKRSVPLLPNWWN
ncbi:hypothetical protein GEMRC1_011711 [Eukaryota sp. GEM-RC1]